MIQVAALFQRLAFSGLGGVIAAVVGGVIAAIAARTSKRAATPAPSARPAPNPERHTPSGGFGESAPPVSAARRLYGGPIPGSEPTESQPDEEVSTSLDDDMSSSEETPSSMVLRSPSSLIADWQAREAPAEHPPHSTLWNHHPFLRSMIPAEAQHGERGDALETPIWSVGFMRAGERAFTVEPESPAALATQSTPVLSTWLYASASALPADTEPRLDTRLAEAAPETEAPLWSTYLRRGERPSTI